MKEVKLKEILTEHFANSRELSEFFEKPVYVDLILHAMREACKQTLELAAKNVRCDSNYGVDISHTINKQSILGLINKIK